MVIYLNPRRKGLASGQYLTPIVERKPEKRKRKLMTKGRLERDKAYAKGACKHAEEAPWGRGSDRRSTGSHASDGRVSKRL